MKRTKNKKNNTEKVELVHSGSDYFSRLELIIKNTTREIHLQFYILENDTIGSKIIEELLIAAKRGVQVYLLLDSFGSFSFPNDRVAALTAAGIHIRFFAPFLSLNSFSIGRRMHHKLVVADAQVVLLGGINIADKYLGSKNNPPWLDYSVQINTIKIGAKLELLCRELYLKKKKNIQKEDILFCNLARWFSIKDYSE